MHIWIVAAALALTPAAALAGEADIVDVKAVRTAAGVYDFHVTVRHGDTGWDHYADRFQVLAPDGSMLGERVLLHPHVGEQPFTRSLGGVEIPDRFDTVTIRAGDNVHAFGGVEKTLRLPGR